MRYDSEWMFPINEMPELRLVDSPLRRRVEDGLGTRLPDDYIAFISHHYGQNGYIGESFVRFFPLDQLKSLNQIMNVDEFVPELLAFASDGGGVLYSFDKRFDPMRVVGIEGTNLTLEDAFVCAKNFTEFLS